MVKLLIYGTGSKYLQLKKLLKFDYINLIAFIESVKGKETFEGYNVYIPEQLVNNIELEYDFILIASSFEQEIRQHLKSLNITDEKIISGNLDLSNILDNLLIFDINKVIAHQNNKIEQITQQVVSRNLFYDMCKEIPWIKKDISIIGGGWSVGYDYMYVMLRALQVIKPASILEMGLGQSSKILIHYQKYSRCKYDIMEQDENWYQFFLKETDVPDEVNIHIKPLITEYNTKYETYVNYYTGFNTVINKNKYSFISIDGPWGSDGLSRADILPYIPNCLENSFCIMLDDYERPGEQNMIHELERIMHENNIEYFKKVYGSYKKFCIIVSADNEFLCSLY